MVSLTLTQACNIANTEIQKKSSVALSFLTALFNISGCLPARLRTGLSCTLRMSPFILHGAIA